MPRMKDGESVRALIQPPSLHPVLSGTFDSRQAGRQAGRASCGEGKAHGAWSVDGMGTRKKTVSKVDEAFE
jgi:hypothetical protein